ncbi:hypothetical protein FGB62_3g331 [Gracilaria domingensis]|nr:hypothetical protein FGB62_3g331 [Gracilaria domingensis]
MRPPRARYCTASDVRAHPRRAVITRVLDAARHLSPHPPVRPSASPFDMRSAFAAAAPVWGARARGAPRRDGRRRAASMSVCGRERRGGGVVAHGRCGAADGGDVARGEPGRGGVRLRGGRERRAAGGRAGAVCAAAPAIGGRVHLQRRHGGQARGAARRARGRPAPRGEHQPAGAAAVRAGGGAHCGRAAAARSRRAAAGQVAQQGVRARLVPLPLPVAGHGADGAAAGREPRAGGAARVQPAGGGAAHGGGGAGAARARRAAARRAQHVHPLPDGAARGVAAGDGLRAGLAAPPLLRRAHGRARGRARRALQRERRAPQRVARGRWPANGRGCILPVIHGAPAAAARSSCPSA